MEMPGFWDRPSESAEILRTRREVERRVETLERLRSDAEELATWQELIGSDGEADPDALAFAARLEQDLGKLDLQLKLAGPDDDKNAILSINAGAGGTESCDWCSMLMRMYTHWIDRRGFTYEIVDMQPGDEAGTRNVTLNVQGEFAYGYLKAEKGVHRLVRISPFDANKRRHTSFAAVDVIPEIDDTITIEIRDEDLRVDTYRSSGAGGQYVNRTDSAVRLTHLPTGVVVSCQSERSQHKNRSAAMKMLRAKLYALEEEKRRQEHAAQFGAKSENAWGSQIRSYVLQPYQMVKDLRTEVETSNVNAVLDGDLDAFIEAYLRQKRD